jgi:hypothetical protein
MSVAGAAGAYGYQELIIEPETDIREMQDPTKDEPEEGPAEPNLVETVLMEQHEPNAARTEIQKIPGPYETASAHGRQALTEPNTAKPAHRNPPIRGTYATIRVAAFIVVGVFALVIILGVAILARSRRA